MFSSLAGGLLNPSPSSQFSYWLHPITNWGLMSGGLGKGSNQTVSRSRDYFFFFARQKLREVFPLFQEGCALICWEEFFFCVCLLFVFTLGYKLSSQLSLWKLQKGTACGSFDESISICVRALPGQPLTVVQTERRRRLSGSLNALVTCVKSLADSLSIFN